MQFPGILYLAVKIIKYMKVLYANEKFVWSSYFTMQDTMHSLSFGIG